MGRGSGKGSVRDHYKQVGKARKQAGSRVRFDRENHRRANGKQAKQPSFARKQRRG